MQGTGVLLPSAWLVFIAAAAWAYPGHSASAVAAGVLLAVALAVYIVRGAAPSRRVISVTVALTSIATLVPAIVWTALDGPEALMLNCTLAACAIAAAVLTWPGRRRLDRAALAVMGGGLAVVGGYVVANVRRPLNDTWFVFQQASGSLLERNIYGMEWAGSPGLERGFVYPPGAAFLVAPARWIVGDVRWGFLLAILIAGLVLASRDHPPAALLLWAMPGTILILEWSWNEPLLLALLVGALVALGSGQRAAGIVLLSLALVTKQHTLVLLPLLAAWRPLGVRGAVLAAGAASAMCLPWVVADPARFVLDTVFKHLRQGPRGDAQSLYTVAMHHGWTPPLWVAGLLAAAVLAWGTWQVARRPEMPLGQLAALASFTLLAVNLLNKQTFFNQHWLVAGLTVLAMAELDDRSEQSSGARAGRASTVDRPLEHLRELA